MFAMSQHLGEHPTLIGNLVGIAIASTAIEPLEQLLEQNDCPNLYWALSYMPNPLIKISTGMEGDRVSIYWFTQDLQSTAAMSADQIKKVTGRVDQMMADDPGYKENGGINAYVAKRVKDAQQMAALRKRLVESGLDLARLATFPGEQLVLLDEERELRARFDEIAKLIVFPDWQFAALNENVKPVKKEDFLLAFAFLPAQTAVRRANAARAANGAAARRRGTAHACGRAQRQLPGEVERDQAAASRRPRHRQAVPIRGRWEDGDACAARLPKEWKRISTSASTMKLP